MTGNVAGNLTGTVLTATQNSVTTATGLVSVGALDSGSITSSFGNIDVGASNIDGGTITADSGFAGNLTGNVTGDVTGDVTGTSSLVTVTDSTANTAFPVVFNDESNALLDDTGSLTYNPSSGELVVTSVASNKLSVDQDGTGVNSVGSVTLGAGNDAALWVASDDLYIQNDTNDKDIIFRVNNDNNQNTEVMRVDASSAKVTISSLSVSGKISGGAASTIEFDGGVKHTVEVPSGDDTLDATMYLVRSAHSLTLPQASANAGREYIITCIADNKTLTVGTSGDNLYYSADKTAASDGTDLTTGGGDNDVFAMRNKTIYRVISDGVNWYVV